MAFPRAAAADYRALCDESEDWAAIVDECARGERVGRVVWHHAGGPGASAEDLKDYQERERTGSYHLIIDASGVVWGGVALRDVAWHALDDDRRRVHGVGVCLMGDDRYQTLSPEAFRAVYVVTGWLAAQGFTGHVTHRDLAPTRKPADFAFGADLAARTVLRR